MAIIPRCIIARKSQMPDRRFRNQLDKEENTKALPPCLAAHMASPGFGEAREEVVLVVEVVVLEGRPGLRGHNVRHRRI